MSFKDVKRKAMAASSEVMTLASVDDMAVYAGDDYESVNGYSRVNHSDEKYSTIDELKNITMDSSQINITQEDNSQYIPFRMPRYYDGIDLSMMNIFIRYSRSTSSNEGYTSEVVNVQRNSQYIRFGWLVDNTITSKVGDIRFQIEATGNINKTSSDGQVTSVQYKWMTKPVGKISIIQGLIGSDSEIEVVPGGGEWQTYENRIIGYVNEAKKAADSVNGLTSRVGNLETKTNQLTTDLNNDKKNLTNNYYTKTQTNTKISDSLKPITAAINAIDSLANLDATYDSKSGKLTLKDKKKNKDLASVIINGLANLSVEYTAVDGAGQLTFMNGSAKMFDVNIGSIDPSTEWVTANITPINNSIQSIQEQQTKDEQKITNLASSLDEVKKTDIPQIKKDVSQATNSVANMKQTVDGNKEAVDSLGTNFDTLEGRVKKLEENPASTKYDVDYADNIFYWKENGETIKTFTIQGGGGSGTTTSTMTIERITPADAIFLLGNKAVIEYTWSSVDNVGDSTGIGTAVWKIDSTTVSTLTVGQGKNSIDLTEFLKTGTNSIRLSITDSVGTLSTKTWTITIVDFKLESSFNDTLFYSDEVSFRYTPYGNINKTVHFILDGNELDSVNTTASGRQLSYVLTKQSHGAHLLKVYMTATVNNQDIQSETIIKDIIWVNPDDRTPIIGCSMQEFTTQQYHATNIPYVVYDPDHNPATVKLAIDGNTVSTLSVNRTAQTWSYKSSDIGNHNLTISCRKVTKILKANIEKLDIDVEPVTANLEFDFNPTGYSNSDENRLWTDKTHANVNMTVSDNFDWSNGGYQLDSDGSQYFCVKAGTRATINYNLFGTDPKQTGSEFKIVFKTTNVRDASATFLSCMCK